jgi:hypothetical protein
MRIANMALLSHGEGDRPHGGDFTTGVEFGL